MLHHDLFESKSIFWLTRLTSQYGSLNMMLYCLIIPCLCTRSCFALTLFLGPCHHVFSFLSTLDGICYNHMDGLNLVPCFPIESTSSPANKDDSLASSSGSHKYTTFVSFLEDQDLVVGPQGGHPTKPLVTHPTNKPYAINSCMFHMHIAFKLNVTP